MTAPRIDLDEMAAELGMTDDQVSAYLREAIAAGFLRVISEDGTHVLLEATTPDEKDDA